MDTCSNCGASVRPGAKFCTACGTRLNDVDTSNSSSSDWSSNAPVEDTPSATEPPVDTAASTQHADADAALAQEPTSSTSTTAWTWGSSTSDDPAERTPVPQPANGEPESSGASDSERASSAAPATTGDFQWSWGASAADSNESQSDDASSSGERMTSQPSVVDERESAEAPLADAYVANDENREDVSTAEDVADRDDREAELADAAPPYDWRESVSYSYEERPPVQPDPGDEYRDTSVDGEAPAVFADSDGYGSNLSDAADARARAIDLLDELRSLIPSLGASAALAPTTQPSTDAFGTAGHSADMSTVIADLESARSDIGPSDELRTVLEAAQSSPRDMDVILDLVGRSGSLLGLLDERDRLVSAIERALSSLR